MAEDDDKVDLLEFIAPKPKARTRTNRPPISLADAPELLTRVTEGPGADPSAIAQGESSDEGRLDVRPIGTPIGLKELAALHKKTWTMLNVEEKRVHMMLWPLA